MSESTSPTSSTQQPSTNPSDTSAYYTWSTFFSILTATATPETRDAYFNHRDDLYAHNDIARCEKDTSYLLAQSPVIRFLRHNIQLLSPDADINESNVRCTRCKTEQSGGFSPEHGILICANKIRNRGHLEDTLAHEMVHAWDYLRFDLDGSDNLRHAACMEVCVHYRRCLNSRPRCLLDDRW